MYLFKKKNDYNIQLDSLDMAFTLTSRIKRNKDISKHLHLYMYDFLLLTFKAAK